MSKSLLPSEDLQESIIFGLMVGGLAAGVTAGVKWYLNRSSKSKFVIIETTPLSLVALDELIEELNDDVEDDVVYDEFSVEKDEEDDEPSQEKELEHVHVFAPKALNWNEEYEVANRVLGQPYIISVDVFLENEHNWTQETLTYYQGDDIVADQADTPVYGYSNIMGPLKFGHGSGDPTVVYIRNEHLRREWEVLLHRGRFEIEVLGHTMEQESERNELKHSYSRKFRDD